MILFSCINAVKTQQSIGVTFLVTTSLSVVSRYSLNVYIWKFMNEGGGGVSCVEKDLDMFKI